MRKKALLVGALPPFEGPEINLEEGVWLVEPPSSGEILIVDLITKEVYNVNILGSLTLVGPIKIRAIVVSGEVHVDAKQVA